jgi:thiol reductant ABC exporter CydC subunit
VDLLDGAAELVAFGATDMQLERVSAADAELTRIARAAAGTAGAGSALLCLLGGLVVWGVLLVGVPSVHSGRLDGPLLAVIALVPLALFDTVATLPAAAQCLARVRSSAARLFAVVDATPAVMDSASAPKVPVPPHDLRIQSLRVRYRPGDPWALDGIDLDLPPGRRLGIVGPSGAGKSTLAAVLLRLVPYDSGSVRLDGAEISTFASDDVRRVVGLAAQDSHVFETTLRENLRLARRDAPESALRTALDRARLLGWVDSLPDGLDTEVGQHGLRLSGGQRQRLVVARVFLAGFPVSIFDEPGEHLDTATADALMAEVVEASQEQTVIVISHRLAGMERMDEIVVLDAGRVVERGTHATLVAAGGAYAHQWQREGCFDAELAELEVSP